MAAENPKRTKTWEELVGPDFDERVARAKAATLDNFDDYLDLVRRVEADPRNADGADKTWVERTAAANRAFYRQARRAR